MGLSTSHAGVVEPAMSTIRGGGTGCAARTLPIPRPPHTFRDMRALECVLRGVRAGE
jgi:hypothetical protein